MNRLTKLLLALIMCAGTTAYSQGYQNPVLPGFYPDPSVCRCDSDYYMVNSSFQFFPGVPIHHSKDLIHWEPIGHCLTRQSQVDLEKMSYWLGIYAPTIRYNNGRFYMITTNVPKPGQLLVSTNNPAAEWSEPIIMDQPGIDPDLFFDDNGKCYLISSDGRILISEIDIASGRKLTESKEIWNGTGARYSEGPHMYKKDGWYYLMLAEGGTEYGHKMSIARARSPYGPFLANPANPILTHINSNAASNPIQGVGHADIIQAHDGSWWMVALGFRPQSYNHHLLGRETFLAPIRWDENAWPVVNGNGTINLDMKCATLPQQSVAQLPERNNFDQNTLGFEWNYLCNPHLQNYSLSDRKGFLRLKATSTTLDELASPTFVGRRQQHINFKATAAVDATNIGNNGCAGATVYMSNNYRYDICIEQRNGKHYMVLTYLLGAIRHTEREVLLGSGKAFVRVEGTPDYYNFSYSEDGTTFAPLGKADTRFLSSETAGGFTGVYIGLFAQNAKAKRNWADFDWFDYSGK